ncbi:hypothetical protein IJ531_06780 [bacterium]|nr:hypothetical protein [bacterium]
MVRRYCKSDKNNFCIKSLCFREICYGNKADEFIYSNIENNTSLIYKNLYIENLCEIKNIKPLEFDEKIFELIQNWKRNYKPEFIVCDGLMWELKIELENGIKYKFKGNHETPDNFEKFEEYLHGLL